VSEHDVVQHVELTLLYSDVICEHLDERAIVVELTSHFSGFTVEVVRFVVPQRGVQPHLPEYLSQTT
jgi:hypothetical protein